MDESATENFIEINIASKYFRDHQKNLSVLEKIRLSIPEGRFFSFLGPSGCGKTTLLKLISGLDKDFDGYVKINQKLISKKDLKNFGFVFQESNLLPWKNTQENISFFCKLLGKKCNIEALIKEVGLEGFEKYYPNELSGGMQKRAALARALAMEPKVLFMDEPFESLDEFTKQKLYELLLKLQKKFNITVVLVTHNIAEAVLLSDTVITLAGNPTTIKSSHNATDFHHGQTSPRRDPAFFSALEKIYADFNL